MALTPKTPTGPPFLVLSVVTITSVVIFVASQASAAACRFGANANCIFPCRCQNQEACDGQTGACQNGCADGSLPGHPWTGPACQTGNVAYQKTASQPGSYAGLVASYAVDGQLGDQSHGNKFCAHPKNTENAAASWTVDLGDTYTVASVTIYNVHHQSGALRLQQFTVSIGGTDVIGDQSECDSYKGPVVTSGDVTLSCNNQHGRYVSIRRYGGYEIHLMTLCEVVVTGYKYIHPDCSRCDGTCSEVVGCSQCVAGKLMPDCRNSCASGFGVDCEQHCGHCANMTQCAPDTGDCTAGCEDWYGFANCTGHIAAVDLNTLPLPTITAYTSSSVTVSCLRPAGLLSGLETYYTYVTTAVNLDNADAVRTTQPATAAPLVVTLTNLQQNTRYNVSVTLEASHLGMKLIGTPTQAASFRTGCSAPDKPTITEVSVEDQNVVVTYQLPGDAVPQQYTLEYRLKSQPAWTAVSVSNKPPFSHRIGRLDIGTYVIRLRATNNCNKSSLSDESAVTISASSAAVEPSAASSKALLIGVIFAVIFLIIVIVIAVVVIVKFRRRIGDKIFAKRSKTVDPSATITSVSMTTVAPPNGAKPRAPDPPVTIAMVQPIMADVLYDNIPAQRGGPIALSELAVYVEQNEAKKFGFMALSNGPAEVVKWPEYYKKKNRFDNVQPYGHSCVKLEPAPDIPHSDYINASFITGYPNVPNAYVACQGPKKETISDMWRMIWQLKADRVVMLTELTENGRRKCEQYWPDGGEVTHVYGLVSVTLLSKHVYSDFILRAFSVTHQEETRRLHHFQFVSWPDKSVPSSPHPVIALRNVVRLHAGQSPCPPLIVHCSAGIGRTGSFIALDCLLEEVAAEKKVDVEACVTRMRTERMKMVQTDKQYVFLHRALLAGIATAARSSSCSEFCEQYPRLRAPGSNELETQFENLTSQKSESKKLAALQDENLSKNRTLDVVPDDKHRPFLTVTDTDKSDYINASFVTGYRGRDEFLVTQVPLENTRCDFWRLIFDHKVPLVVLLENVESTEETYWPSLEQQSGNYGNIQVMCMEEMERSDSHLTERLFTVTHPDNPGDFWKVRQLSVSGWPRTSGDLPTSQALLAVTDAINAFPWTRDMGPIVVQCWNGATRGGVVCAACHALTTARVEKRVDLQQTVEVVRRQQTQLVDSLEQYRYLHEIIYDSLMDQPVYENIKTNHD